MRGLTLVACSLFPRFARRDRAIAIAWGDEPESEQHKLAIERRTLN